MWILALGLSQYIRITNKLHQRGVWGRNVSTWQPKWSADGKEVTGYVDPSARTLEVYSE